MSFGHEEVLDSKWRSSKYALDTCTYARNSGEQLKPPGNFLLFHFQRREFYSLASASRFAVFFNLYCDLRTTSGEKDTIRPFLLILMNEYVHKI